MKIVLFILLLVSSVAATFNITELVGQLPQCSIQCLVDGVSSDGCSMLDIACHCSKAAQLTKTISPCFAKAGCTLAEMTDAAATFVHVCEREAGNTTLADGQSNSKSKTPATGTSDSQGIAMCLQSAKWACVATLFMVFMLL
ncbi:hypothetical protein PT974_05687 [Cladobotryum mycophilum]|uniref:CFEM domain-containing protein n=1 Tax=Cladobotryum mycophilum TaxID=491253 RepID=A0ABR0SKS3_9HYPO